MKFAGILLNVCGSKASRIFVSNLKFPIWLKENCRSIWTNCYTLVLWYVCYFKQTLLLHVEFSWLWIKRSILYKIGHLHFFSLPKIMPCSKPLAFESSLKCFLLVFQMFIIWSLNESVPLWNEMAIQFCFSSFDQSRNNMISKSFYKPFIFILRNTVM